MGILSGLLGAVFQVIHAVDQVVHNLHTALQGIPL